MWRLQIEGVVNYVDLFDPAKKWSIDDVFKSNEILNFKLAIDAAAYENVGGGEK